MVKKEPKTANIPRDIFFKLCRYFLLDIHEDEDTIRLYLTQKLDALAENELYTKSKTAPTQEERDQARKKYLDKRNIPSDYRW